MYVYLDHAATTPMRPEVREAMAPYFDERFGNPSSMHRWGRQARNALEQARERVAGALGAARRDVVFTGGGTEADNIAVLGRWRSSCAAAPGSRGAAVVCTAVEHKAVGAAAQSAADEGAQLIILGVDEYGRVDPSAVEEALRERPCVVSVIWANNEVGTIQPVAEIAALCRAAGVAFHSDAVQAFGKLRVRVDEAGCDMVSISAHKVGGPKGIGALCIRESTHVLPLVHGGGQERELRPGTENVAAAVGFATAAELAVAEREEEAARLAALRDLLEAGLRAAAPDLIVNGPPDGRLPNILNVTLPDTDQEGLLIGLDLEGVAASGASACASGTVKPSHVLAAMGALRPGAASVRLSLGRTSTAAEIDTAIAAFGRVVDQLRTPASYPASSV
ncbi:MAG: cysteine desulfurase family protein [Gemmatimonadota bacterium]